MYFLRTIFLMLTKQSFWYRFRISRKQSMRSEILSDTCKYSICTNYSKLLKLVRFTVFYVVLWFCHYFRNWLITKEESKALVKVVVSLLIFRSNLCCILGCFFSQQGRTPHIVCRSKEMRTLLSMNSSAAANVSMGWEQSYLYRVCHL